MITHETNAAQGRESQKITEHLSSRTELSCGQKILLKRFQIRTLKSLSSLLWARYIMKKWGRISEYSEDADLGQ